MENLLFCKILDEQIADFNSAMILSDTSFQQTFKSWTLENKFDKYDVGFRCFGIENMEYYSLYNEYIQRELDCGTRCILLSGVLLRTIFEEYPGVVFEVEGIEESIPVEITTEEFEDNNGFEYILRIDNMTIGFRYRDISPLTWKRGAEKKIIECIEKCKIDKIVIIDMHYVDHVPDRDTAWVEEKLAIPVQRCSILDLFQQYSSIENYNVYVDALQKTIEKYKDFASITTIPKLTAYSLYRFRFEQEDKYSNYLTMSIQYRSDKQAFCMPNSFSYGYFFVEKTVSEKKHYICLDNRTQQLLNETSTLSRVRNKKLYRALIGRSNFARCFLTSEYLYQYYNKKDQFDYVAIISGYLKSVEQLMFVIAESYSVAKGEYKKYNKKKKMLEIITSPLSEDPDTTMGGLCFFFQNNKEIIAQLTPQQKETLINCLFCYKDECRNDSFHKHNISDWDRVEHIRSNTFLIYSLLLGCCDLGNDYEKTLQIAVDDRLSRIIYQMQKSDGNHFNLQWAGKEVVTVYGPDYQYFEVDAFGIMKDKEVSLYVFCEGEEDEVESDQQIVLSENALPDSIWYDNEGNRQYLKY